MSGKGSGRLHDRTKLSDEEMKKRWDAIFGKKDKPKDKERMLEINERLRKLGEEVKE